MTDQRLFGLPGYEEMYFSIADCYESDIEWGEWQGRIEVEEWTIHEPATHLPKPQDWLHSLVDWMADAEVDEGWVDQLDAAVKLPEVIAAAESTLNAVADQITYRMASEHVSTHVITWDESGEPLINDEPLYVATANQGD